MAAQITYLALIALLAFTINFFAGKLIVRGLSRFSISSPAARISVAILSGLVALAVYFSTALCSVLLLKPALRPEAADYAFLVNLFSGGIGLFLGIRRKRKR